MLYDDYVDAAAIPVASLSEQVFGRLIVLYGRQNFESCQDAVQQALLILFEGLAQGTFTYRNPGEFYNLTLLIARREMSKLRRAKRGGHELLETLAVATLVDIDPDLLEDLRSFVLRSELSGSASLALHLLSWDVQTYISERLLSEYQCRQELKTLHRRWRLRTQSRRTDMLRMLSRELHSTPVVARGSLEEARIIAKHRKVAVYRELCRRRLLRAADSLPRNATGIQAVPDVELITVYAALDELIDYANEQLRNDCRLAAAAN